MFISGGTDRRAASKTTFFIIGHAKSRNFLLHGLKPFREMRSALESASRLAGIVFSSTLISVILCVNTYLKTVPYPRETLRVTTLISEKKALRRQDHGALFSRNEGLKQSHSSQVPLRRADDPPCLIQSARGGQARLNPSARASSLPSAISFLQKEPHIPASSNLFLSLVTRHS